MIIMNTPEKTRKRIGFIPEPPPAPEPPFTSDHQIPDLPKAAVEPLPEEENGPHKPTNENQEGWKDFVRRALDKINRR